MELWYGRIRAADWFLATESIIEFWNEQQIPPLVLLSFTLQVMLTIVGRQRKSSSGRLLSAFIWLFYISAESVSIYTLAILAKNQAYPGDSSSKLDAETHALFIELWTPFLLLHLGGSDTITSYSLEDNKLWPRNLLGLVVRVIVSLYACFIPFVQCSMTFAAMAVFLAGIIKPGERLWALYSSTSKHIKHVLVSNAGQARTCPAASANYLSRADYLYNMSLFMFSDLHLGFSELRASYSIISSVRYPEEAFELVEVELGLIYDSLHTKLSVICTKTGLFFRSLSFWALFTAFLLLKFPGSSCAEARLFDVPCPFFQSTIDYDLAVTYILLFGGLLLEVYELVCLILSDQTMIWIVKKFPDSNHFIYNVILYLHNRFNRGKRWSGSIAQYSLIGSCLESESKRLIISPCIHKLSKHLQMDIARKDVKDVPFLKKSIYEHLGKKADLVINIINNCPEATIEASDDHDDDATVESARLLHSFSVVQKRTATQFHNSFLPSLQNGFIQSTRNCRFEETISLSHDIIIWHIATDLCYHSDLGDPARNSKNPNYEISKALSQYMVYLLAKKRKMLPTGDRWKFRAYKEAKQEMQEFLKDKIKGNLFSIKEVCMALIKENLPSAAGEDKEKKEKSTVILALHLAKELQNKEFNERWNIISEVWKKLLCHAANHCEWRYHEQQLNKGGEFLTHVCLLMVHFGLSEQFQEFIFPMPNGCHP